MAGYDPQARRPRPAPPAASPVDGLLDQVDEGIDDGEPLVPSDAPVIDLPLDGLACNKVEVHAFIRIFEIDCGRQYTLLQRLDARHRFDTASRAKGMTCHRLG